jgi:hypothetical protein
MMPSSLYRWTERSLPFAMAVAATSGFGNWEPDLTRAPHALNDEVTAIAFVGQRRLAVALRSGQIQFFETGSDELKRAEMRAEVGTPISALTAARPEVSDSVIVAALADGRLTVIDPKIEPTSDPSTSRPGRDHKLLRWPARRLVVFADNPPTTAANRGVGFSVGVLGAAGEFDIVGLSIDEGSGDVGIPTNALDRSILDREITPELTGREQWLSLSTVVDWPCLLTAGLRSCRCFTIAPSRSRAAAQSYAKGRHGSETPHHPPATQADGTIERMSPSNVWVPTGIGPNMLLGGEKFQTLSEFIFFQLHDMRVLSDADWKLRISQQMKIGSALRKALLGNEPIGRLGPWVHLKPEASDGPGVPSEFLDLFCRVPWSLMTSSDAPNATFVALNPVEPQIITLDVAPDLEDPERYRLIRFPSAPRVLLVMPEVKDESYEDTSTEAHATALCDQLRPHYDDLGADHFNLNLRFVETFDDFAAAIGDETFDPHLVYFYGHGLTAGAGTDFVFRGRDGAADERSVDEIQQLLSLLVVRTKFPPVVWFNACFGAAAKQESALRILGAWTCCMITTRTLAAVDVSRRLAEYALPAIIVQGLCPTVAIRNAILAKRPTVRGARWANLVIAVHFDHWRALGNPERQAEDRESVGDFPMRCDRVIPLGRIEGRIKESLAQISARTGQTVAVWCGDFD